MVVWAPGDDESVVFVACFLACGFVASVGGGVLRLWVLVSEFRSFEDGYQLVSWQCHKLRRLSCHLAPLLDEWLCDMRL